MAAATRSKTSTEAETTPPPSKQVSILFVCLGNICRSPMAEGVFRSLTHFSTPQQHPLISQIDSCGTGAYHAGSQPDSRTLSVLAEKASISNYRHNARRIRIPSDFEKFDYILAMDADNLGDMREMVLRAHKRGLIDGNVEDVLRKVQMFGNDHHLDAVEEVQDPYYGGRDGFEVAYEQVERFGRMLLKRIEREAEENEG